MSALSLTAAMVNYGHVQPLLDGTIQSERVALEPISHLIVVKDALLDAHPWLAETLCSVLHSA